MDAHVSASVRATWAKPSFTHGPGFFFRYLKIHGGMSVERRYLRADGKP